LILGVAKFESSGVVIWRNRPRSFLLIYGNCPNDSAVDQKLRDWLMKKILSLAAMVTMLAVASSAADAKGPGGIGGGASSFSPGQSFRANGPVSGTHGASGYAPGHQMKSKGPGNGYAGASGYAPGKLKP
jgi:hypothetical protein